MKRLLYTLLALAAAVGCTKDAEVTTPSDIGEAVSFTITDDLTRATTHKTAWEEGDKIAIFVGDATTATCYVVQDGGATLTVDTDATPIEASDLAVTYNAYYPYKAGNTQADYLADTTQDVLTATTAVAANGYAVTLTFTHVNSYITINYSGMTSLSITDGSENSIVDKTFDESSSSYSFYHAAVSAEVLKGYTICVNDDYYTSAITDDITAWEAGTPYIYNLFTSCDINYANGICEIYTTKGLAAFRDMVNDGSTTSENLTIKGATVSEITNNGADKSSIKGKLMANIDIGGEEWTPIGTGIYIYYSGTFDGNGFEVRNLTISEPDENYQGLFGYISGATIKNLGVTGSVTATDKYHIGGVVGYAYSESEITNCYNKASVSGSQYVGGVVGWIDDDESTISNCYNTGAVEGSNGSVGGVVGKSYSAISNCYNTGVVKGSSSSGSSSISVGGIAGYTYSNITCCYNMGDVYSESYRVGGVAGCCEGSTILNCFNIGDVTGSYYVGGVMGYCTTNVCYIYNSYNLGSVKSTKDNSALYYTGGIAGYAAIDLTITNCYNAGTVSNSNGDSYTSKCGSIAGRTNYITASNCYYPSGSTTTNVTIDGSESMDALEMKGSDFVETLNTNAASLNTTFSADESNDYTANNWQFNYNTYPTLTGLMFNDSNND